jgi:hypothetical protein
MAGLSSSLENLLKDLNQTLQRLCEILEKDLEFRERELQWRMETAKRIEERHEGRVEKVEAAPKIETPKPDLEETLPPATSDEATAPVGWLRKQLDSEQEAGRLKYELYETNEGFTVRVWSGDASTLKTVRNWVKWARTRMLEKLPPEKARKFSEKLVKG